jgi:epoxyqueuosine reductase
VPDPGREVDPGRLKAEIALRARELGFDAFGVAPAEPLEIERARLREWLARGYHGSMGYLARAEPSRLDPGDLLPGAQSVLCVAANYHTAEEPAADVRIARYARGRDYHRILRGKLRALSRFIRARAPGAATRICVDTAPILEKAWAERAGIGWRGKHTNLVSRALGSWTLLGEILTTLRLPPDEAHLDFCGSCTRCLDACPTSAFPRPYVMDATRCISYLTIEHRGTLDPGQGAMIGEHLFGCDICLEACPWNRFARLSDEDDFSPRPELMGMQCEVWAALDDDYADRLLRGSALRRATPGGLRRNAAQIIRNRGARSI